MTPEDRIKFAEDLMSKVGEYFDHVQIMATWQEDDQTKTFYTGLGNWHARQGMAHEFINKDIAQENAHQIGEKIIPPTDENDNWKASK